MKTIEEKAKAYDEAIKKAKDMPSYKEIRQEDIEYLFPELKESEDERIKKEIIEYIKTGTYHKDWIAWLEKQGKLNDEENAKVFLLSKGYPISANGDIPTYNEIFEIIKDGIEYQQKQCEKSQGKTALESINEEKVDNKNKVDDFKFELNFDFSVGQWIVACGKKVFLITKIDGFNITLVDIYGNKYVFDVNSLKDARLWTIQDAKPGDVLASDKSVFIYAKVLYDKPYAYCGVDNYGVFKDNCLDNNWTNSVDNIHPATKEQRDLLFQKMEEAGYEWNAEKKELEKIKQNSAWCEEDEKNFQGIIDELEANKSEAPDYDTDTYNRFIDWLKSLKERIDNKKRR